jgi:iron complex outermembrane receptor protein
VNKYNLKNFNFSVGARYDYRSITTSNTSSPNYSISEISKKYNNISTSGGISYTILDKITLRTSFATGFRSPNLNELTANGFKLESQRFEVGNANFKKEHNNQFDFNVSYNETSFSFEGSFFINTIKDFIYIEPTGNLVASNLDPSNSVNEYKFNQADAQIIGGEIIFTIHPKNFKYISFENKYATLTGTRLDNNSYLPMMSPTRLSNTLYFNFNDFRKFSNTTFHIALNSTFDQNQVAANEQKTKGYSILNFGVATKYKKTTLTLNANNILDKTYVNHLSRYRPYNISEPGLNISISAKIPIDIK